MAAYPYTRLFKCAFTTHVTIEGREGKRERERERGVWCKLCFLLCVCVCVQCVCECVSVVQCVCVCVCECSECRPADPGHPSIVCRCHVIASQCRNNKVSNFAPSAWPSPHPSDSSIISCIMCVAKVFKVLTTLLNH